MKSFFEYHNLTEETEPALHESDSVSVRLGSNNYTLELAETPDKIYKGMSGRDSIPRKTGMLFVMPKEDMQEFCIRDCKCNMDIIFVNEDNEVVGLDTMVVERPRNKMESEYVYENRLKKYSSDEPAKYVIEIPAGDITRLGLKKRQIINIPK